MGLKLLDEKNREHSFGGEHVGAHLMEMLVGVPALPLEPFVVVGGLSPDFFPSSEVHPFPFLLFPFVINDVILYFSPTS